MKEAVIKTTPNQSSFIESYTAITDCEGKEAYFIPYWFEKKGEQKYAIHRLGRLPKWIRKLVANIRGVEDRSLSMLYTDEDMIEFARRFLIVCQKGRVTPLQLEMFNKEKGYE